MIKELAIFFFLGGARYFYRPLRDSLDKIWAEVEYGKGTDHRHLCRTSFPAKETPSTKALKKGVPGISKSQQGREK